MEYHQAIATIRFIVPCLNCVVMIVIWPWKSFVMFCIAYNNEDSQTVNTYL